MSDNLIERVKELLREGNVTRIIGKNEKGDVLLEIPATVGVIGVILVPWLAALGAIAALATKCRILVEKKRINYSLRILQKKGCLHRSSFISLLICLGFPNVFKLK